MQISSIFFYINGRLLLHLWAWIRYIPNVQTCVIQFPYNQSPFLGPENSPKSYLFAQQHSIKLSLQIILTQDHKCPNNCFFPALTQSITSEQTFLKSLGYCSTSAQLNYIQTKCREANMWQHIFICKFSKLKGAWKVCCELFIALCSAPWLCPRQRCRNKLGN